MLHGPLTGKLLLFTLPIALSSMVQQLFNAADTAIVGYFGSESALAAVGTNTEMIALIVTVSSGLSIGANILIAHSIGRNQTKGLPDMLRTAMLLAALFGTIGLLIGQITAAPLLRLIQTPRFLLFTFTSMRMAKLLFMIQKRKSFLIQQHTVMQEQQPFIGLTVHKFIGALLLIPKDL